MREMARSDVEAVLAIEQAVQRFPWTYGNFIDALNSGYLCCVEETDSGEICGYAILRMLVDEAELLTIGVAAVRQRKGLGRAMLGEMLELVRNMCMKRIFLEVRSSNVAAIALYRNTGFCEMGVRRDYYRNTHGSEDALVMARELAGEPSG